MTDHYDFIIAGAGLSGLSMAIRLATPDFVDKRVLLMDMSDKKVNDRTWSFWAKESDDRFKSIYKKSWDKLAFYAPGFSKTEQPGGYRYNTVKGLDFYNYCFDIIKEAPNISFIQGEITDIAEQGENVIVRTSNGAYTGDYVFDSLVKRFPVEDDLFVWQHFMGWEVQLEEGTFDASTATFMDFRIDQGDDTRFVYVLPFDEKRALVEATYFSKEICSEEEYEVILRDYMQRFIKHSYVIRGKEIGKIPMTTAPFSAGSERVIPIGTNNATVKPSSGYAFTRIQRESDELMRRIKKGQITRVKPHRRFLAYDRTLLNVVLTQKETCRKVFSLMFKYNSMEAILNFLDETSSIKDEIRIFATLPFWSFLRSFVYENVFLRTK